MRKKEKIVIAAGVILTVADGLCTYGKVNAIAAFVVSAAALVLLAKIVGDATEQLGSRFGPAATGILQSALGNLPELFIAIFALRAGLLKVVQAALIGSILSNSLLVLGLAIFIGGLKNGAQRFVSEPPKMMATLMILAFAGMAIPTVIQMFHTPAAGHINQLDIFLAIVLLIVFIASVFVSLKGDTSFTLQKGAPSNLSPWPLSITFIILIAAGAAAAFVSDWFVDALQPAMTALHISDTFAGLVIVAIAGNAVENVVGIQLAYKNQPDYALSVIMNSSLQIALGLFPLVVLLSFFIGGSILSFALTPMLLVSFGLAVIVSALVVTDGKSLWLEGLALTGLYLLVAAAFWWG
jgi:Ca2+:H+ antiporter